MIFVIITVGSWVCNLFYKLFVDIDDIYIKTHIVILGLFIFCTFVAEVGLFTL